MSGLIDGRIDVDYDCTAPTIKRFHADPSDVRIIMGPQGSGKSFGICGEIIMLAKEMPPCTDGVRRTRVGFIRDTATNIKDTTLQTWLKVVPEDPRKRIEGMSWVNWSQPFDVVWKFPMPDGTRVELQIWCRHQGHPDDAENLASLELTHVYVNEIITVPEVCVLRAFSRCGRYPDKKDLAIDPKTGKKPAIRFCKMGDCNMPHEKHWLWKRYLNPPQGWAFFRQPPACFREVIDGEIVYVPNRGQKIAQGIMPAENIDRLQEGWGYYTKQIAGNRHETINVLVCAQPGIILDGLPVYGNYNADSHFVNKDIPFQIGKTLFLGFDWGLWPTCVFVQMSDEGRMQVIDLIDGEGEKCGIEQLWENKLMPKLVNDYNWGRGTQIMAFCDPAVGTSQVNMDTCAEYLGRQGLVVIPCLTNKPSERIGAVDHFLRTTVSGGKSAFAVSKKAYKIHEGMSGYYCLKEKTSASSTTYSGVPEKNEWSHSQDALQYVAHAIKNPSLYNIKWRNRNNIDMPEVPAAQQGGIGLAGVI